MVLICGICNLDLETPPPGLNPATGTPGTANISAGPCGHVFHDHCLKTWIAGNAINSKKCPVCPKLLTSRSRCTPLQFVVRGMAPGGTAPNPLQMPTVLQQNAQGAIPNQGDHDELVNYLQRQIEEVNEKLEEKEKMYSMLGNDYQTIWNELTKLKLESNAKQGQILHPGQPEGNWKERAEKAETSLRKMETSLLLIDGDAADYPLTYDSIKKLVNTNNYLTEKYNALKKEVDSVSSDRKKLKVRFDSKVKELEDLKTIFRNSRLSENSLFAANFAAPPLLYMGNSNGIKRPLPSTSTSAPIEPIIYPLPAQTCREDFTSGATAIKKTKPSLSNEGNLNMEPIFVDVEGDGDSGSGRSGASRDEEDPLSFKELMELMSKQDLITNVFNTICSFCAIELPKGEGIALRECNHTFCRHCLISCIQCSEDSCVKCPHRDYVCDSNLQEREIKALVSPELFEAYLTRTLKFAGDQSLSSYHCKTFGCTGWCVIESDVKRFFCPTCKKLNCISCAAVHDGMDCQTYQRIAEEPDEETKQLLMAEYDSSKTFPQMVELLENQAVVISPENTECPICFSDVPKGEGIMLKECLHTFCRECLTSCVEHGDEPVVKCPFNDGTYSCECVLQEREIKAIVPTALFEKYLKRSVKCAENQTPNSYHCKTPDCVGWCEFDDNVNTFDCPVCTKANCITCRAIHEGMDCKRYQAKLELDSMTDKDAKKTREMFENMIKKGEAMHCPKCNIILQKKVGCDWLMCTYCKMEICWATRGPRWGPKGRGDTSGGCKCNFNGKRCHPKCGNCH